MDPKAKAIKIQNFIDRMPALPVTMHRIIEICNDPRTSPADLNQVISIDPVLMGKVLRLINSAYYGLNAQITSLVRAIIMLGLNTIKNLALSTAVLGSLGSKATFGALNADAFWMHSLSVGVLSKKIALGRNVQKNQVEEFFIAGLLHDLGKLPLNKVFSDEYFSVIAESERSRKELHDVEVAMMGFDHCMVGRAIMNTWNLTDVIQDCVIYHHTPLEYQGVNLDYVYTVTAANFLVNDAEIGFAGDRYPDMPPPVVWERLGISDDYMDKIKDEVLAEIEKAKVFLKIAE
jgi:HD-like signal output (HDOD) protein